MADPVSNAGAAEAVQRPLLGPEEADAGAVDAEGQAPEGVVVDAGKFEVAPHLYRLEGEETVWESSVHYAALSPWGLFDAIGVGEDILVVTSKRVFICQARSPPLLGILSIFKPRYCSTILRRRDVSTLSLHRRIRYPWFLVISSFVWLICASYILSAKFTDAVTAFAFVDNWWAVAAVGLVFLLLICLLFTNDWVVTISHCNRKMVPLTRDAVTARVNGPEDVAKLEESIRAGYLGGGGYIVDRKAQKKDKAKPAYVATRHLSLMERGMARRNASFGSNASMRSFTSSPSPRRRDTPGINKQFSFERMGSPTPSSAASEEATDLVTDEEGGAEVDESQLAMVRLHKRLLPGEQLLYRCKNTIRVLWCIPVGNNTVAVTNKRLLIKKARYPIAGVVRNVWVSRYFYASIPIGEVRTFQHAFIRLFGRQRFIWSAIMLHVTLLLLWLYENEKWCGGGKLQWWRVCDASSSPVDPGVVQGLYCVPWLPPLPWLLLEIPEAVVMALPGVFLVLMVLFNFNRGWGLVLDVNEKSQLTVEELRISLTGPAQMNAIEAAVRTRKVMDDDNDTRADGFDLPGEEPVGECEGGYGKVRITSKRLLVCRNPTASESRGCFDRWVLFWFRDYHVGSFDINDVIACSTRWIPLHSNVALSAAAWVGFWCLLVGTLFRYKACNGATATLYCDDIPSLVIQGTGLLLLGYALWGFLRHRSPGLVFSVKNVFSFRYHRPDFMRLRMRTFAVNQVQEWLREMQERAGCYLPEGEEEEIEQESKLTRYSLLTVMGGNDVRISPEEGQPLPEIGDAVRIPDSDPTGSVWHAVGVTNSGAVRLHCDAEPDIALNIGSVGDDLPGGLWMHVPKLPEEEARRLAELDDLHAQLRSARDALGEAEAENRRLVGVLSEGQHNALDLKEALKRQTHDLIQSRGDVARLQQERVELSYRGDKAEQLAQVRQRLLRYAESDAGGSASSTTDGGESPPSAATPATSPPPGTPPAEEVGAWGGGGGGLAGDARSCGTTPPAGNPLAFSQQSASFSAPFPRRDFLVDTPPPAEEPPKLW